jgi:hypothetical protein
MALALSPFHFLVFLSKLMSVVASLINKPVIVANSIDHPISVPKSVILFPAAGNTMASVELKNGNIHMP